MKRSGRHQDENASCRACGARVVKAQCWCQRGEVWLSTERLRAGSTLSCGRDGCQRPEPEPWANR